MPHVLNAGKPATRLLTSVYFRSSKALTHLGQQVMYQGQRVFQKIRVARVWLRFEAPYLESTYNHV